MSKKKRKVYPRLRVMAEYASSGIWAMQFVGLFRHGMVSHGRLQLPPDLRVRFEAWIEKYWQNLKPNFDVVAFDAEGLELARALKTELGVGVEVVFAPEDPPGGLGEEQPIQ